jgi:hypothetical protein
MPREGSVAVNFLSSVIFLPEGVRAVRRGPAVGRSSVGQRVGRVIASASLVVLAALGGGCSSLSNPSTQPGFAAPVSVGTRTTFAASSVDPESEIEWLARQRTPPARLRVAWLQLQLRRPQRALDATSEVLYGPIKPSANEESFARFLRAEAFALDGRPERGEWDLARAAEVAVDADLRALIARKVKPVEAAAPDVAGVDLVVQPRQAWQASAPERSNITPMGKIHRVTIHHSAMYFRDTRPATCATQIQMIQRDHMRNRDYGDIGYHYLIDPSGRIWQGRDLRYQGAHASGNNNVGNVGICLLGNFVRGRTGQGPTAGQVRALRHLTAVLVQQHAIRAQAIYSHSDFKATDCPGALMLPVVDQLVRDMHQQGAAAIADTAAGQ